jgi:type I site-specific restriction-modification system R (restriction) subunit
MTNKITEYVIEQFAIELLERQGYQYVYGPDIAPDSETGIASDLKKALLFYSDAGGRGDPAVSQEQAVQLMLEKLEIVSQMFHGFAYEQYFEADTGQKLSLILSAEEHIPEMENGKKRFIDEVAALSQAFSIAIPHDQAMDVKDEIKSRAKKNLIQSKTLMEIILKINHKKSAP